MLTLSKILINRTLHIHSLIFKLGKDLDPNGRKYAATYLPTTGLRGDVIGILVSFLV